MPKVPQIKYPKPEPPKTTMIVCTTDGKPLSADDQKALEEYMDFRIKKAKLAPPVKGKEQSDG